TSLPGCPDIVFPKRRVAVFCDGDFWHGRDLENRLAKLAKGHNANYWLAKITRNVARDVKNNLALKAAGWVVLRLWETDVLRAPQQAAEQIAEVLAKHR